MTVSGRQIRVPDRLSFKQARWAILVAFSLGLVLSLVQIIVDLSEVQEETDTTVQQVISTVRGSASQAAFEIHKGLAENVLSGLFEYRPIYRAVISVDDGQILANLERDREPGGFAWLAEIAFGEGKTYSVPLFVEPIDKPVGELSVSVDLQLLAQGFFKRSGLVILLGVIRNIALAAVLVALFYVTLTKPLMLIIDRLASTRTKDLAFDPVGVPAAHERDELGVLVRTFNELLAERLRAVDALRESEERFRGLVENSPNAVSLKDVDGRYLLVNEHFETLLRVSRDNVIGKTSGEIFDNAFAQSGIEQDREVIESRQAIAADEQFGDSDRVQNLLTTKFPIFDGDGEVIAVGAVHTDLTDRLEAEEALRQAQKMEVVGQLTGGVAHDFNNLLAIILGNLELVQGAPAGGADFRKQIEMAIRATERGAHMTQRLLAFSRKQALRPVTVDVRKLIQDMQDLLRRSLGETVAIEIVAEAGLWDTEIDPNQLESALLNLAINARDAMPDGGKLTIEASNARLTEVYAAAQVEVEPGQYVLISVSDIGTGMAPAVRDLAFDPFFTTKETGKGTGLGLSMVYGFVKQSGGHIAIDSEVGEGTTFKLYLPRYKGERTAVDKIDQAGQEGTGKGEMILVVEDDADFRSMINNMLQSLGYGVLDSDSARGALVILDDTPNVDLLLTDLVLPGGMSGRVLADRAQDANPDLPVLFMSGYTENAVIHHGRLDEGVELLEKPFRRADLSRAIRKVLDRGPA